jgi:hypothetical protein
MEKNETPKTCKCLRCGRALRSAASIAAGYGPTCGRKIRTAAQAAGHKPAQVAKALELIEDGGLVPVKTRHNRVYMVVAANGTDRYLTARQACTCAAGLRGGYGCYHRIAAELVAA